MIPALLTRAPHDRRLATLTVDVVGRQPISRYGKVALALEILMDYCRVRWHLSRAELPRVVERLRATPPGRTLGTEQSRRLSPLTGIHLGRAVVRTLRLLPTDSRCLMRSLVLTSVLSRRGIDTTLTIAARTGPDFIAHAWLERDGIPLLAPGDDGYHNLTTF